MFQTKRNWLLQLSCQKSFPTLDVLLGFNIVTLYVRRHISRRYTEDCKNDEQRIEQYSGNFGNGAFYT